MAKKGKKSRDNKAAGKKSVAKLAKSVDRLSARLAALEKDLASHKAAVSKEIASRRTAKPKAPARGKAKISRVLAVKAAVFCCNKQYRPYCPCPNYLAVCKTVSLRLASVSRESKNALPDSKSAFGGSEHDA